MCKWEANRGDTGSVDGLVLEGAALFAYALAHPDEFDIKIDPRVFEMVEGSQ